MKLATFALGNGEQHLACLSRDGTYLVDLTASDPNPLYRDTLSFIDAGARALDGAARLLERGRVVFEIKKVRLLPPIPRPRRLRDFMCFEQHVRQSRANRYLYGIGTHRIEPGSVEIPKIWYERPVYYKANTFNLIGHEATVEWPSYSKVIDYELELAVVLGKMGKNVSEEDALSYVFGYCIFNDFSARDAQYLEMTGSLGPAKGKDFDTGNSLGPWIVTADEIRDPQSLEMVARVNGEEWSRGNSRMMHHSVAKMISYASWEETLQAGEVLGTGTVGGGAGTEFGKFMKDGDMIELEVSRIGVLRNYILAPQVPTPPTLPMKIM